MTHDTIPPDKSLIRMSFNELKAKCREFAVIPGRSAKSTLSRLKTRRDGSCGIPPDGYDRYPFNENYCVDVSTTTGEPVIRNVHEGNALRWRIDSDGYASVFMRVPDESGSKNKGRNVRVHYAVLFATKGPPPTSEHTPDHLDRDRSNNNVTNLKWSNKTEQTLNRGVKRTFEQPVTATSLASKVCIIPTACSH